MCENAPVYLIEIIENKNFFVIGQKVILDIDLAFLYGIETFNLNMAVERNIDSSPDNFMFQLRI